MLAAGINSPKEPRSDICPGWSIGNCGVRIPVVVGSTLAWCRLSRTCANSASGLPAAVEDTVLDQGGGGGGLELEHGREAQQGDNDDEQSDAECGFFPERQVFHSDQIGIGLFENLDFAGVQIVARGDDQQVGAGGGFFENRLNVVQNLGGA